MPAVWDGRGGGGQAGADHSTQHFFFGQGKLSQDSFLIEKLCIKDYEGIFSQ